MELAQSNQVYRQNIPGLMLTRLLGYHMAESSKIIQNHRYMKWNIIKTQRVA